jgi:hypothetical protein
MTDPLHLHLTSDERGAYTLRMLTAAIGDDKKAHNLTCDDIERRTRGCTICSGELHASQCMLTAGLMKAVAGNGRALAQMVGTLDSTIATLLDKL